MTSQEEISVALEALRAAEMCLGSVCLGMTPDELAGKGGFEFWPSSPALPIQCDKSDNRSATFKAADGMALAIGFRGYPLLGAGVERYRVSAISYVEVMSEAELAQVRRPIVQRLQLRPEDEKHRWVKELPMTDIYLDAGFLPSAKKQSLVLHSVHKSHRQWWSNLPQCQRMLPRL